MVYTQIANELAQQDDIEISTMMGTPCLRYRGGFVAMMFSKQNSLIIKVSPERVNKLIKQGIGNEFNFTKKRFKEWVLIPLEFEGDYRAYIEEAIIYAKNDQC